MADHHVATAVKFADEAVQKMFKAMARSEQEHIKSLKDYLTVLNLSRTDMAG